MGTDGDFHFSANRRERITHNLLGTDPPKEGGISGTSARTGCGYCLVPANLRVQGCLMQTGAGSQGLYC